MLFQFIGGLQIQILETIKALNELGINAKLINPYKEKLTSYDLVHIFSAINGNHRIAEHSRSLGLPVVSSPLIRSHWTKSLGKRARFLESLVGRFTNWEVKTEYRHILTCLGHSNRLIALGNQERQAIIDGFNIDAGLIDIIPNGIPVRFFNASPEYFVEKTGIKPGFVLCVAAINPYKNQSMLVKALNESNVPVVLIGPCLDGDKQYLDSLLKQNHVHHLGTLNNDDPLLASAYAAAEVFCLPSMSEVMPISMMEALAAGTPAVITNQHGMDISQFKGFVSEIPPTDSHSIREALHHRFELNHSNEECKNSVRHLTWESVAKTIVSTYSHALSK